MLRWATLPGYALKQAPSYWTSCHRLDSENMGQATRQKTTKKSRNREAYQRRADCSQVGSLPTKRAFAERLPCSGWNQEATQSTAQERPTIGPASVKAS